ncbi:TPA: nucleotide pyrophosphohydrolase [candidate division CPR2 bacterium]|uniref:Uncharacterized protein n=1 Tax=candidate division CPR2 bacterium GW2011_GWC1_41_48 TaxID=1618344 RepID=A0A0G0W7U8_UNCC2|nr:MAG: hypothetical protein UT47_C0003G0111 [candidate division CPR2 bacterium GW2011_GWC2_39_35]KKR27775.1 MAG: hypothetical protein UT59_C0044G0002 [candidate division CPR2 bacterium GW2011_GWD1_39_7]KKS09050.1 MAG: hypothetical protein UU65_C0003G0105 [candidate division CPR2 bacterium GW2011_GWC1_41_48]OGB59793.1 MAG: hypothetical protein A2Y27_00005 [candidate division CPR2 bacterium GWD1_39_7]HBG81876.1 nucleotide pyrophosphohydrolase [candidate division CPR2 bacterium]
MEFKDLSKKAIEIKDAYGNLNKAKGEKAWGVSAYAQGFAVDVGDLLRLMMARDGLRTIENIDEKIAHELADCLWSVIVIAGELNIDLEEEFLKTMGEIKERIEREK